MGLRTRLIQERTDYCVFIGLCSYNLRERERERERKRERGREGERERGRFQKGCADSAPSSYIYVNV